MQWAKIFNAEIVMKFGFNGGNERRISPCNKDIINIDKKRDKIRLMFESTE